MFADFKVFLTKSNALALAIGVIIGTALGGTVNSLVNDIIMPPIGLLLGRVDFSQLKIVLQEGVGAKGDPNYVAEVAIRYGIFLNLVVAFIVLAFIVFVIGRLLIRDEPAAPAKTCGACKEANAVDATRCKFCTSDI